MKLTVALRRPQLIGSVRPLRHNLSRLREDLAWTPLLRFWKISPATSRELLRKREASSMAIGGTSAGGNLALVSVLRMKQLKLPLPAVVMASTPWADLGGTGDSYFTNEGIDRMLITEEGLLAAAAKLYADGADLKQPLISPVYGVFAGFPPNCSPARAISFLVARYVPTETCVPPVLTPNSTFSRQCRMVNGYFKMYLSPESLPAKLLFSPNGI